MNKRNRYRHAKKLGFRSGLEVAVARDLEERGVPYEYETIKIEFTEPEKARRYTPDFILPNGIIVETKGQFTTADRQKMKMIKEQHPNLDIRIVFNNPNARISKQSQTTYAMWCDRHGFPYARERVPNEWLSLPKRRRKA